MKEYFMFLMSNVLQWGELTKANFYGGDYASVEFENDGKKYSISLSCEEIKTEVEKDA